MCLAKQLQQLMTCKCCCASSDSRKLQCNFLNSATTVSQTLVIMQKKKKYIYILDICSVYTEHFPGVARLMDICIFRKNRIHDTGDAPLTVIKSRPLLDKWLWRPFMDRIRAKSVSLRGGSVSSAGFKELDRSVWFTDWLAAKRLLTDYFIGLFTVLLKQLNMVKVT